MNFIHKTVLLAQLAFLLVVANVDDAMFEEMAKSGPALEKSSIFNHDFTSRRLHKDYKK